MTKLLWDLSGKTAMVRAQVMKATLGLYCALAFPLMVYAAQAAPSSGNTGWPEYNNGYLSQRWSRLKQINTGNASDLREKCVVALGDPGAFESEPLVIGDTLYVATAHTTVAIDASDCKVRWRNVYKPEQAEVYPVDRGLAYMNGRLFRGTGDGRLLAIDAKTGKTIWTVDPGNPKVGEFYSSAPIAWNGLVFIGPAGSDWGIRGRMTAFDAATGKQVWRFDTIPMGNEPGAKTWKIPATAKHGGGGMWTSYTLDPSTGELFVPVANPSPDYNPVARPGENLYTNSLVVLDAKTGKLKWYYQLSPHDGFDYDLGAAPMLYTDKAGQPRVALGSKDGYLYVLDRKTHKLAFKTALTTIFNADKQPTPQGVRACPGSLGGVEWNGPAWDPQTHAIYVNAVDWCGIFTLGKPEYSAGKNYFGTKFAAPADEPSTGWINAVDGVTGKMLWRYHATSPVVAGITPTAGGVVLTGDLAGEFMVFDARTGKLLHQVNLGGALAGGVITYAVNGQQYVAATAGNVSRATWGANGTPHLVILTTGLPADYQVTKVSVVPAAQATAESPLAHGKTLYGQFCVACHGAKGEGGIGPALQDESVRKDLAAVMEQIKNPKPPMPKLYPSPLTDQDVQALATYVETIKKLEASNASH